MANNSEGKLLHKAPLKNYLIEKILGVSATSVIFTAFIFIIADIIIHKAVSIIPLILILGLGFLILTQTLCWALSNRVKIYDTGIVPAFPPFKKMFKVKEYFAPYNKIVDIVGGFSGTEINRIVIELENGEKSIIYRINVGKHLFSKLLIVRDSFYHYTENNKKIHKIPLNNK